MAYLKRHPDRGALLESVYNQHVASLALNVPATLGEIVLSHFLTEFRTSGNAFPVYNRLALIFRISPTGSSQQEATQAVYKRTALESPDFAMNAPGEAPKSTSLMTGGFDARDVWWPSTGRSASAAPPHRPALRLRCPRIPPGGCGCFSRGRRWRQRRRSRSGPSQSDRPRARVGR
jgi:hypothetical protein